MSGPTRLVCPHCKYVGTTHQQIRNGATIRCSQCHHTFRFSLPENVAAELEVVIKPEEPPIPWYKDRTLQIGLTIPAVILTLFFGYLAWQHHQTLQRERVVALKTEADTLARSGKITEAYQTYRALIALGTQQRDPETLQNVDAANRAISTLKPAIEEAEKKQQEERRLAEAAKIEEMNRKEMTRKEKEEQELKRVRLEKMALIKGEIKGGAWITKKVGNSDIVRGMEVALIKKEIKRSLIDRWLVRFKDVKGERNMIYISISGILEAKPDDDIDVKPLLQDARSDTLTKTQISEDASWPAIAVLAVETVAVTDIEGKYEFKNVKGGEYYIFASYNTLHFPRSRAPR